MRFVFNNAGNVSSASAGNHNFTMKYERTGEVKVFLFEGKTPSRRLLREMVKQCEKLK